MICNNHSLETVYLKIGLSDDGIFIFHQRESSLARSWWYPCLGSEPQNGLCFMRFRIWFGEFLFECFLTMNPSFLWIPMILIQIHSDTLKFVSWFKLIDLLVESLAATVEVYRLARIASRIESLLQVDNGRMDLEIMAERDMVSRQPSSIDGKYLDNGR